MDFTHFPKSSNVDGAHYDATSKTLIIKYKSGGQYTYADVPENHWHDLQKADSVGGYLYKHIRNKYKSERLEEKKQ